MKLKNLTKPEYYKRVLDYRKKFGTRDFVLTIRDRFSKYDIRYEKWAKKNNPTKQQLQDQKSTKFKYEPLISIITPVYNTPQNFLHDMINSVIDQTYINWELCIADGNSDQTHVTKILQEYSNKDKRIKITTLDKNLGIAENTNAAIDIASGDYITFLDHDDTLAPNALHEAVCSLQNKHYDMMYSDEDIVSDDLKRAITPVFKPDFSPQLLECHNYFTHMVFVSKALLKKAGKLNKEFDGAQDYDFVLRSSELANEIHHIPIILYHWRTNETSVAGDASNKMYAYEAGKKALENHFERIGVDADVEQANLLGYYHPIYHVKGNPLLSIIIPNKDQASVLKRCINSLYNNNDYQNFEIIIVENNSEQPETFKLYDSLTKHHNNLKVITYKDPFNYSAINNFAANQAKGEYFLFLNNDTEILQKTAISEMLGTITQLPDVGVVGAKLFYDNDLVQHAGVIVGFAGFAGHIFILHEKEQPGYMNRAVINCNYSAVTAACLMVEADTYNKVGGFSEDFVVAINDIDFCLKVRQAGKYIVCNNFSKWRHYESISRGDDEKDPEKLKRLKTEIALFQKKWPDIIKNGDPFYNANFTYDRGGYSLKVYSTKNDVK